MHFLGGKKLASRFFPSRQPKNSSRSHPVVSIESSMVATDKTPRDSVPRSFVDTRKRVRRVQKMNIDLARLEKYFGMPLYEAAQKLGVSTTTVKKKCREFGVKSWPRTTRSKAEQDDKNEQHDKTKQGDKIHENDTSRVDQKLPRPSRPSSEEQESESEGTSNTSIPTGGNSASSGASVRSQSPSAREGEGYDGASDNSGSGGGSENHSSGGERDTSGTSLDEGLGTGSQDSSSTSKRSTSTAPQLSVGLGVWQQPNLACSTDHASQAPKSYLGGVSGDRLGLYPAPLAPVNPQSHQSEFSNYFLGHNSMTTQSPAQFASSHSPAHFSSQVGAHHAPSNSHPFSGVAYTPQLTSKEQAAADVSREVKNLQLLQQQTELQMLRLQRAELDLKIQSLQQTLGSSVPVGRLPMQSRATLESNQASGEGSSIAVSRQLMAGWMRDSKEGRMDSHLTSHV